MVFVVGRRQLFNIYLSKTNQSLQLAFVILLEPLRRFYLNFRIIFVSFHHSLQSIIFSQPAHHPFSRYCQYGISASRSEIDVLSGRLPSFLASVSCGTQRPFTFPHLHPTFRALSQAISSFTHTF
jgi:hypothetical protein